MHLPGSVLLILSVCCLYLSCHICLLVEQVNAAQRGTDLQQRVVKAGNRLHGAPARLEAGQRPASLQVITSGAVVKFCSTQNAVISYSGYAVPCQGAANGSQVLQ